jgi:hypothetical protein
MALINATHAHWRRGFFTLLAALGLVFSCACSDRPATAARATVENFYGAIQNDNLDLLHDNVASSATPQFRSNVDTTAAAAQTSSDVRRSVQVVTVHTPQISDGTAQVRVELGDGEADTVQLAREGLRWKVVSTGRLR